ncbi:MAG: rhomboid family intramembrane serine protease [Bacteroidales bacterium]|nr:rhomboid family intramembrane serine protease [Lentimicrobiaceae bacterium]MDD5694444.1 rhomboid family intramembrane serine protease [Bacteroidales bacterium]
MSDERNKLVQSIFIPSLLVILLWIIKGTELIFSMDLGFLGIYPLQPKGLPGILLSPLIHNDVKHLAANTLPLLVLGTSIIYFYREIAYRVLLLLYIIPGIWVWFGGREAYHIGASGVIYAMAAFLFFSGLIRRDGKLMALSLLVVFLYGSMVWGIFPNFMPEKNISWESHLMGLLAGLVVAIYYRARGPQRKKYEWELEEEEENSHDDDDDDDHDHDQDGENDSTGYEIRYTYKE